MTASSADLERIITDAADDIHSLAKSDWFIPDYFRDRLRPYFERAIALSRGALPSGTVSEREAVLRERRAFIAGRCDGYPDESTTPARVLLESAARRYPLPTVERPRVVQDPHSEGLAWRVVDNGLQYRRDGLAWRTSDESCWTFSPARVALWADLFARPTELVEDVGSGSVPGALAEGNDHA
jgi:hypothetical protein